MSKSSKNTVPYILLLVVAAYSLFRYFTTEKSMYLFPAIACVIVLLYFIKIKSS